MTETSGRFALPFLQPGQAQKELFHNEAIALIDGLIQPAVVDHGVDDPPADPAVGAAWIVGTAPTAAWSGRAGQIALWTSGGWRFVAPRAGSRAWIEAAGCTALFDGGAWLIGIVPALHLRIGGDDVVGPRRPAIAGPTGGTNIDGECRSAVDLILAALRDHGLIAT